MWSSIELQNPCGIYIPFHGETCRLFVHRILRKSLLISLEWVRRSTIKYWEKYNSHTYRIVMACFAEIILGNGKPYLAMRLEGSPWASGTAMSFRDGQELHGLQWTPGLATSPRPQACPIGGLVMRARVGYEPQRWAGVNNPPPTKKEAGNIKNTHFPILFKNVKRHMFLFSSVLFFRRQKIVNTRFPFFCLLEMACLL